MLRVCCLHNSASGKGAGLVDTSLVQFVTRTSSHPHTDSLLRIDTHMDIDLHSHIDSYSHVDSHTYIDWRSRIDSNMHIHSHLHKIALSQIDEEEESSVSVGFGRNECDDLVMFVCAQLTWCSWLQEILGLTGMGKRIKMTYNITCRIGASAPHFLRSLQVSQWNVLPL